MADATSLPTISNLKTFQASLPAFQVPALQYGLNDTDVTSTVTFSGVLKDGSGATVTGGFLGTAKTSTGYAETMWFPLLSSTDGQTFTGVVRGIKLGGIDYTTGTSGNVVQHFAGEEVFVGVSAVIDNLVRDSIQGVIATGGNNLSVGDGTAGTKTYKIYNNTGAVGIIRNTGTKTQYSDDGLVWVNISDVSSSVLVKATSADTTAGYLNDKIDTATAGRLTKSITNPAGNEQVALTLATTLTDAEMNQMHGISANVTSANLNTLTAGAASNADALHTHSNIGAQSYTAYEAITQYDAVALLPIETKWYDQLSDTAVNLGDANARRKYAVKYIPSASGSLTDWNFRAAEQVNASTNLGNLVITIETDSAGAPSGTALTNATATISQVTQRTWNTTIATRTATFGGTVNVTAGTTYWVVYACSATDATNYLKFGANDSYVANYLTFTRLTYNLDTATWGSSSTTSILFGWSNTTPVPFGYGLARCINTSGAKTWGFIGVASAAISAQSTGAVSPQIAAVTGLTPGASYYIGSSSGSLTSTPPQDFYNAGSPSAYSYKVGVAASSTVLLIQPGQKMTWGTSTASASTTLLLPVWFKPKDMLIRGGYIRTANTDYTVLEGRYDGTNNRNLYRINDDAGAESYAVETAQSFGVNGGTDYYGTGGTLTDIGLTYTVTKVGGPSGAFTLIWTITG